MQPVTVEVAEHHAGPRRNGVTRDLAAQPRPDAGHQDHLVLECAVPLGHRTDPASVLGPTTPPDIGSLPGCTYTRTLVQERVHPVARSPQVPPSRSVRRAAGLLTELAEVTHHELSLSELARRLGVSKSSCQGLLQALVQDGLVTA